MAAPLVELHLAAHDLATKQEWMRMLQYYAESFESLEGAVPATAVRVVVFCMSFCKHRVSSRDGCTCFHLQPRKGNLDLSLKRW